MLAEAKTPSPAMFVSGTSKKSPVLFGSAGMDVSSTHVIPRRTEANALFAPAGTGVGTREIEKVGMKKKKPRKAGQDRNA
jgi:hypothetical protein